LDKVYQRLMDENRQKKRFTETYWQVLNGLKLIQKFIDQQTDKPELTLKIIGKALTHGVWFIETDQQGKV
jgi:hypothetical protein